MYCCVYQGRERDEGDLTRYARDICLRRYLLRVIVSGGLCHFIE
jgi:hypothetical protein